jgi:xylan 1,4-beta-xylosidase
MTLQQAMEEGALEQVKEILLQNPSAIEEKTKEGVPLCLYGARTGNLQLVQYIVEYSRASLNTVDGENRNILHYAAMSGNAELSRYLVEKAGMSVTAGDRQLVTPYEIAVRQGHQELVSYYETVTGAEYGEMYHNPIRRGMFPDPSIVRLGEDYYMVNSSFIFFPCIPISHSRDLIHWEIIGHAITNPKWAGLDGLEGGRGYWAPDISYDNGMFYITATYRLNDSGKVYRRQIVVSSKNPEGPYSEPSYIEEDGIDPSLFHEDGRHYMLLNRGARILELSSDCKKQISKASLLYYGDYKRAPEGPHLLKKDGYYYLFLAEGGTGMGHRITVARSRELMGNYEPCPYNPIMRQMDEKAGIQRCGHGKPVCTQNGEWYMVYLCGRRAEEKYSILGRETALDPITWTEDGWPMVNHLDGPSVLQKKPDLPEWIPEKKDKEEMFCREFMTPRPPEEGAVQFRDGKLFLKGSKSPLSCVDARNILVRRQDAFCFLAEAEIRMPELMEGQECGLTCYYDENTWVCFYASRQGENYFLQVREHIGSEDRFHGKREIPCPTGKKLLFGVETEYLNRSFYYRYPEDEAGKPEKAAELTNVYYLCDEGLSMGKRFTGAMVGMYGYGGEEPLTVEITDFRYRARE